MNTVILSSLVFVGFVFIVYLLVKTSKEFGKQQSELQGYEDAIKRAMEAKEVLTSTPAPGDGIVYRDDK